MPLKQNNISSHHRLPSLTSSWQQWWDIFSQHFVKWIFLSFIPWFLTYVVFLLIFGKFSLALPEASSWGDIFGWHSSTLYFIIIGVILILALQIFGSLVLFYGIAHHQTTSLKQSLMRAPKFFFSYLGLSILLTLIASLLLAAAYLIIAVISALIGLISLSALDTTFIVLEIVPILAWIISGIIFIFAPFALIEKQYSIFKSIAHSWHLALKAFWALALRLVIAYIIIFTLALLLNLIPWVGPIVAVILVTPALFIYIYVLYQDLENLK